jgi:2-polyprenyl-3-methyl-5-hydroxy-6-metoxy-1,4-benzoquinol methylase
MMDFSQRLTADELMDDPECDEAALFRTLDQFSIINKLFSRTRTLLRRTILTDMQPGREYHLLDVGAGACDIPIWLLEQAHARQLSLRITAVDSDPRITRYAQQNAGTHPDLTIVNGNGLELMAYAPFDYVFANHVLHHLPSDLVKTFIREAEVMAGRGVVFSDLKRSRWSYLGFWIAALPFRHSFARTDGLLSIRRGFLPAELEELTAGTDTHIQLLHPGRVNVISNRLVSDPGQTTAARAETAR